MSAQRPIAARCPTVPGRCHPAGLALLAVACTLSVPCRAAAQDDPPAAERPADLQRALDLLDEARAGGADSQAGKLDEAAGLLEKFARENADSPFAGEAAVRRGDVLLAKATAALRSSERGEPGALERARDLAGQAQNVYEEAARTLERELAGLGTFAGDGAKRAERETAIARLIRARIEAARSLFLRARTFPRDDPQRARLLGEANEPLEDLRGEYRGKVGALPGRLLQGQIFEALAPPPELVTSASSGSLALAPTEQRAGREDLTRATAMYDEVLGQQDPEGAGRDVKDALDAQRATAQRLRLGVLNHPLRAEHRLAADEAAAWLKANGRAAKTEAGLGVRMERARALKALAGSAPAKEKEGLLREALQEARQVAAADTADRGPAVSLIARVQGSSGGAGGARDFQGAFDLAQGVIKQAEERRANLAGLRGEERTASEAEVNRLYAEAAELLGRATALADRGTDRDALDRARYLLALAELRRGHTYEAAVLGEYVLRNFEGKNRDIALNAGLTAASAWTTAFQERPGGDDGAFELDRLAALADEIASTFPDSSQADAPRIAAANLLRAEERFVEAADRFLNVPRENPGFARSRLLGGDALWRAYIRSSNAANAGADAGGTPPTTEEERLELQARAEAALLEGIGATESDTAPEAAAPEMLTDAKRTLAQLYNTRGEYQKAADILTKEPHAVTDAVAMEGGRDRPARGVTSAAYAAFVYQQLLRARIGLQEIEPAIEAMKELESIGGAGNTQIFVALGREIRDEIDRLPEGDRRDEVLASFEQFLDRLGSMDSGQNYTSLLWIAETWGGLADALPESSGRASGYRDRAADTFRTLLSKLDEPGFAPDGVDAGELREGVNLRLAQGLAAKGDYQSGYDLAAGVLKSKPNALNVQTTAAEILSDWGASQGKSEPLLTALRGDSKQGLWGWGQIASRVGRAAAANPDNESLRELANAARLRIPATRRDLALTMPPAERNAELAKAERELVTIAATTPADQLDDDARGEMEALYRTLQGDRGATTFDPLPFAAAGGSDGGGEGIPPEDVAEVDPPEQDAGEAETDTAEPVAVPPDDTGIGTVGLIVILLLAVAATAGVWWAMSPSRTKKQNRARRRTTASSMPDIAPIPAAPPPDPPKSGSGFPDVQSGAAKKKRRVPRTPEELALAKKQAARRARAKAEGSGASRSGGTSKPAATPSAPPNTPKS